jgi:hypothetical protein
MTIINNTGANGDLTVVFQGSALVSIKNPHSAVNKVTNIFPITENSDPKPFTVKNLRQLLKINFTAKQADEQKFVDFIAIII